MALASAKQLLDELMGRDRNLTAKDKKGDYNWESPEICKYFIVKFCPNELFVNTKADLGPCSKVHDERLKKDYENSTRQQQLPYEDEFIRFCQGMLGDVEKRIIRARQRLSLGGSGGSGGGLGADGDKGGNEKVKILSDKINNLLTQVEQLGCEGKVEEAQGLMRLCDQLKDEREKLQKGPNAFNWLQQTAEIAAAQEKQMEVCDTCGAFLIVGDAQQRVDDHLMGKQHVGYARLKASVEDLLEKRSKERESKIKEKDDKKKFPDEEERRTDDGPRKQDSTEKRYDYDRYNRGGNYERKRRSRSRERESKHDYYGRGRGHDRRREERRSRSKSPNRNKDRSRSKHHSQRSYSPSDYRRDKERSRGSDYREKRDKRRNEPTHENGEPSPDRGRNQSGVKRSGREATNDNSEGVSE